MNRYSFLRYIIELGADEMNVQESFVTALDESEIYLRKWLPECEPKGIIQIAHGMTEHAGVYTDFIDALLEAGYGVYAHDHKIPWENSKKRRRLWSF